MIHVGEVTASEPALLEIVRHPAIWPHVSDDFSCAPEEFRLGDNDRIRYVIARDGEEILGFWMLAFESPVLVFVHTCLLPSAWGRRARTAARCLVEWIWLNTRCERFCTQVPAYNRMAIAFAQRAGMTQYGLNPRSYMKNGTLHDMLALGMSRPEVSSMPIAAAIPALVGGATSLLSGVIGGGAAKSAAKTQAAASNAVAGSIDTATKNAQDAVTGAAGAAQTDVKDATANANDILQQARAAQEQNINPYLAAGQQGVQQITNALAPGGSLAGQFSFDPSQISSNPNYQFTLNEGMKAVQRAAAAQGQGLGGGTLKGLTQYSQGLATNTINDAYAQALNTYQTNHTNSLNGMLALLNVGQNATASYNQMQQAYADPASTNLINAGYKIGDLGVDAQKYSGTTGIAGTEQAGQIRLGGANATAAGQVGSANAWSSAVPGLMNAGQSLASVATGGNVPMPAPYGGSYGGGIMNGSGGYAAPPAFNPSAQLPQLPYNAPYIPPPPPVRYAPPVG